MKVLTFRSNTAENDFSFNRVEKKEELYIYEVSLLNSYYESDEYIVSDGREVSESIKENGRMKNVPRESHSCNSTNV